MKLLYIEIFVVYDEYKMHGDLVGSEYIRVVKASIFLVSGSLR